MVQGLWGKKIGMTQVFSRDAVIPVTAIDTSSWLITGVKTVKRDGYAAVQIGAVKKRYNPAEFSSNWLQKSRKYFGILREVKLQDEKQVFSVGQPANFVQLLTEGDTVDVFGTTKGCGFAGVVRRYNFAGSPASHGATMGKTPGALSFMCASGKVVKGKKMPGHKGAVRCVVEKLEVIKVISDDHIVLVKGSIPGKAGSLVFIRRA